MVLFFRERFEDLEKRVYTVVGEFVSNGFIKNVSESTAYTLDWRNHVSGKYFQNVLFNPYHYKATLHFCPSKIFLPHFELPRR